MKHDLRWAATPKGLTRRTPWGWQAACICGWEQQGLRGTKLDGLKLYRKHKVDSIRKEAKEFMDSV